MQRKRSNVYGAGSSVLHHRHSHSTADSDTKYFDPQLGVFGKQHSEKDLFTDLRVEIERELALKHANHSDFLRTKTPIARSLATNKGVTKPKLRSGTMVDSSVLVPSSTRQMARRCQSASALRKKLFNAVEQSTSTGYHHPNHKLQTQMDSLRNLTSASLSKTSSKSTSSVGYYAPYADATSLCLAKPPRTAKTQNQDECIEGVGLGPSRSASISNPPQTTVSSSTPNLSPSILVGGYRSSSVQLEVELVERLNEIGRSNLPEKTLSRTRACQNVLDNIVLHDDHFGRLLSRIRDEFSTYVDMTSRKSPIKFNKNKETNSWCTCGQDVFEFALVKQENTVMKKRVNSMQREIEALQTALRKAKTDNKSKEDTDNNGSWTEDEQMDEDDLDDVQLFSIEKKYEQHPRPQGVPMLSFTSLPAYSDEEDDEEEYSQ